MSKMWKWILGILIVLVVAAVAVGAVFMVRNRMLMNTSIRTQQFGNGQTRPNVQGTPNAPAAPNAPGTNPNGQKGPMMPFGFNGGHRPMDGQNWRGPMMGGGGFSHFGRSMPFGIFGMGLFFFGGLLHLILPLGVLVLVAFLFYQMGKRAGAATVVTQTAPSGSTPDETPRRGRKVAKS